MASRLLTVGEYHRRLNAEPKIFEPLRKLGITDEVIEARLKVTFSSIPQRWHWQMRETIKEQQIRRKKVIAKLRAAAKALQDDPELQHCTLLSIDDDAQHGYQLNWVKNSMMKNRPTYQEIIAGLADDIQEFPLHLGSVTRRCTLEKYVCLNIFYTLMQLGVFKRGRPLKETAAIASEMIGKAISGNSLAHDKDFDVVKRRKKYWKE